MRIKTAEGVFLRLPQINSSRKRMHATMIMIFVLVFGRLASAEDRQPLIRISVERFNIMLYEPIYMKMEKLSDSLPGFAFGSLEKGDMRLQIVTPDLSQLEYKAPLQYCELGPKVGDEEKVAFSTLSLHNGGPLFTKAGKYTLFLTDPSLSPISNRLTITAEEPFTEGDKEAVRLIEANPMQFSLFAYLEGGEHLEQGFSIMAKLANHDSKMRPIAASIMAINYSSSSYDFKKQKFRRSKDFGIMNGFWSLTNGESDPYLQIRLIHAVLHNFKKEEIPAVFIEKAKSIMKSSANDQNARTNRMVREIADFGVR